MKRASLCCANCKSQDLEVTVSCVPTAIQMECLKCGVVTPLVVFPEGLDDSCLLAINDDIGMELYEDAYCENITPSMIREAKYKGCTI